MSVRIVHPSAQIVRNASYALAERDPSRSARVVLTAGQGWVLAALIVCVAVFAVLAPTWTLGMFMLFASIAFLGATGFKFWVSIRGARFDLADRIDPAELRALHDDELPTFTVLVPVFREANIVHHLVENLGALDYPQSKLEVLILIEAEDDETLHAVQAADVPAYMSVVIVPPGQPQTKPRACNVGLALATGEYLVIYDAEDAPEPTQLKKVVLGFRHASKETMVIQAPLNYFNSDENALTRMFTLEYSYWFDYMLAGLDVDGLPIPLGGTSNHFRTAALRELGGWDPFNVTEDADLGIRAAALGGRVGVVDSVTWEEANTSIPNFIRQRSRWIKGYMQTALVHSRSPRRLVREVGIWRVWGFILLIAGTPITFLAVIPFVAFTVATAVVSPALLAHLFPPVISAIALINFLLGNGLIIYLNMMGPFKRGAFGLVPWALLNPLYWLLHSFASYKGLWQLIVKPHYWEKTEHGLTSQRSVDGS